MKYILKDNVAIMLKMLYLCNMLNKKQFMINDNRIEYQIIKSKTMVDSVDKNGNYIYNSERCRVKEDGFIFYLKRDGEFIRDGEYQFGNGFGISMLVIVSLAILCGLINYNFGIPFLPSWIASSVIGALIVTYVIINGEYNYKEFKTKEKIDAYIDSKEKISENGVDGVLVERRQIIEK